MPVLDRSATPSPIVASTSARSAGGRYRSCALTGAAESMTRNASVVVRMAHLRRLRSAPGFRSTCGRSLVRGGVRGLGTFLERELGDRRAQRRARLGSLRLHVGELARERLHLRRRLAQALL